jgi:hypothetical protein
LLLLPILPRTPSAKKNVRVREATRGGSNLPSIWSFDHPLFSRAVYSTAFTALLRASEVVIKLMGNSVYAVLNPLILVKSAA